MKGFVKGIDWINAEPMKYYFEALKYCINIFNTLLECRGEKDGIYIYN